MDLKPMASAIALAVALSACVSKDPVVLSARPAPVAEAAPQAAPAQSRGRPTAGACRVTLAEVKDVRSDPQMGAMGWRTVRAADPAAWVRGGLGDLARNKSLALVPAGEPADLTLKVEIVKAYIQAMNSSKVANVVLRVSYGGVAREPRLYRGVHTAMNWNFTNEEIQGAMDRALDQAVRDIDTDLIALCETLPKR